MLVCTGAQSIQNNGTSIYIFNLIKPSNRFFIFMMRAFEILGLVARWDCKGARKGKEHRGACYLKISKGRGPIRLGDRYCHRFKRD